MFILDKVMERDSPPAYSIYLKLALSVPFYILVHFSFDTEWLKYCLKFLLRSSKKKPLKTFNNCFLNELKSFILKEKKTYFSLSIHPTLFSI